MQTEVMANGDRKPPRFFFNSLSLPRVGYSSAVQLPWQARSIIRRRAPPRTRTSDQRRAPHSALPVLVKKSQGRFVDLSVFPKMTVFLCIFVRLQAHARPAQNESRTRVHPSPLLASSSANYHCPVEGEGSEDSCRPTVPVAPFVCVNENIAVIPNSGGRIAAISQRSILSPTSLHHFGLRE